MPAHVPQAGRPPASRARSGSRSSYRSSSSAIVVLSPPGMTRPSIAGSFIRKAHQAGVDAERAEGGAMFGEVALQRQNADQHAVYSCRLLPAAHRELFGIRDLVYVQTGHGAAEPA